MGSKCRFSPLTGGNHYLFLWHVGHIASGKESRHSRLTGWGYLDFADFVELGNASCYLGIRD